jgi:hypothetical protein
MKRVNILEYLDLSEKLGRARQGTSSREGTIKAGYVYFSVVGLTSQLRSFVDDDNGFNTSKHAAEELLSSIDEFTARHIMDGNSPSQIDTGKLDSDLHTWQYSAIGTKIDAFKNVLSAECKEVEIYVVGQVSIYKTSSLVSSGSQRIPAELTSWVPAEARAEFDSAGRCLAFDLPTACGFHALRGVEIMILEYLRKFGRSTENLRTWNEYVQAVLSMANGKNSPIPSKKVAAMLDRMRELDRNPLMHPQDTLDTTSADMLFSLSVISIVEMARDLLQVGKQIPANVLREVAG